MLAKFPEPSRNFVITQRKLNRQLKFRLCWSTKDLTHFEQAVKNPLLFVDKGFGFLKYHGLLKKLTEARADVATYDIVVYGKARRSQKGKI